MWPILIQQHNVRAGEHDRTWSILRLKDKPATRLQGSWDDQASNADLWPLTATLCLANEFL